MSVFLYHHAVATPPSTADAIAISPNFTQPEGVAGFSGVFAEVSDSTVVDIWKNAPDPN
ncbi:MAG TPA: hypothetical protein VN579_09040 [Bryobacteraceae bacterium]|nr:hypothetical protein [Bryobacteraceae bacterium]